MLPLMPGIHQLTSQHFRSVPIPLLLNSFNGIPLEIWLWSLDENRGTVTTV